MDTDPTFGVFFKEKYTEQFRLTVIEDFESEAGGSSRAVARRHGIDEATVRKWVSAYRAHGSQGINRKHEFYSAAFKLSVLESIKCEGLSDREAAARFNIWNMGAIGQWRPPRCRQTSATRKGNCLDNAAMESFFGTLKSECLRLERFTRAEHLREALDG